MLFHRLYISITHNIPSSIAKNLIETNAFDANFFSLNLVQKVIQKIELFILSNAGDDIFDQEYYLQHNLDVVSQGFRPLEHFIKYGHKENRNPCPLFDIAYYRKQARISPHFPLSELTHFLLYGCDRDISPSPWFDFQYYRRANRDVVQANINPYRHYLRFGQKENRSASPDFDPKTYLDNHPEIKRTGVPAISHFLTGKTSLKAHTSALSRLYQRRHGLNSEDIHKDIEKELAALPVAAQAKEDEVELDIILPVYRGKDTTLRCLHSVLTARNKTPYRLIVIDDKSPEPDLSAALAKLAERGHFELLTHGENLGFVKSVNEGMALHSNRDVIFLNSDTEVFANWLDRLRAAAYSQPKISSVTPLTNNGTICSYPSFVKDNPYPLEVSYRKLDELAARVNANHVVQVPTAVGFCMYIKREPLSDVGSFDEKAFGKGYGEENDFCLRTQARGWIDVIATDVFVRHLGAVSFQDSSNKLIKNAMGVINSRYPDYRRDVERFIAEDPLRKARAAIDMARLCELKKQKNILVISHQRGGGTEQFIQEEAKNLEGSGHSLFRLFAEKDHNDIVHLTHIDAPDVPNFSGLHIAADQGKLVTILKELEIGKVLVHHLFELSDRAPSLMRDLLQKAGIPYTFMIHDYLSICPRTNLVSKDIVFCKEPDEDGCRKCLAETGSEFRIGDIRPWRRRYDDFLSVAESVIAPNEDVRLRMKRYFPLANIVTVPHDNIQPTPLKLRKRPNGAAIRIGILGAISPIKGYDVLVRCARHVSRRKLPVEFVVVGYTKNDILARKNGIEITGPYSNDLVLELIEQSELDCIFLPSLWPETFCYTLSIALQTGLPLAAFDIGAIAHRLRDVTHSQLLPLTDHDKPSRIIERLCAFVENPEAPDTARSLNEMLAVNPFKPERYEADIETIVPSEKTYVIFFTPRSGSSFLTDFMSSTNFAGAPVEWFNPSWIVSVAKSINAQDIDGYIHMLKRFRQTPNGVFGAELTHFQYEKLAECTDFFTHFPKTIPFFFLIREDIVLQGISLYKATESGLFHSVNTSAEQRTAADKDIRYDGKKIRTWIQHIEQQEAGSFNLIREHGLNVKILTYENMFAMTQKDLLKSLCNHIGVALPRDIKLDEAPHQKIGTRLNENFKNRFVRENRKFMKKLQKKRKLLLRAAQK